MRLPPPPSGTAVRRVRFREGAPIAGHEVFELPQWNGMSDKKRVAYIRKLVKQYGRDPRIREQAVAIIKEANAPPRDYQAQAAALLHWVNQNIYYVNEPAELLQSAWRTLQVRSGDCDDCHIVLSSLAESIRLPWKTVLSGNRNGQRVRWIEGTPEPKGVKWAHIYTLLGWPPFRPQQWMLADPSLRNSYLGWDIVNAPGMPPVPGAPPEAMPEMSGYGATEFGPVQDGEVEAIVQDAKRKARWESIDWKSVATLGIPVFVFLMVLARQK